MTERNRIRERMPVAAKTLLATVVVLSTVFFTGTAQAFDVTLHHAEGSYAHVKDSVWIHACDKDVDGHRVQAGYQFTTQTSDTWYSTADAPSGGCTEPIRSLTTIKNVRVCVENEGCRYWK